MRSDERRNEKQTFVSKFFLNSKTRPNESQPVTRDEIRAKREMRTKRLSDTIRFSSTT